MSSATGRSRGAVRRLAAPLLLFFASCSGPEPALESAYAVGGTLYLNFDGASVTRASRDDSRANLFALEELSEGATPLEPFPDASLPAGARARITEHVREIFAPFNVTIVTARPDSGNYRMVILTATDGPIEGEGAASLDSILYENPNAIAAVWASGLIATMRNLDNQTDAELERTLAIATAHEIGHTHGLAHTDDPYAIMSIWGNAMYREAHPYVGWREAYTSLDFSDYARNASMRTHTDCSSGVLPCPAQIENSYAVLMRYYGPAAGYLDSGSCLPGIEVGWSACARDGDAVMYQCRWPGAGDLAMWQAQPCGADMVCKTDRVGARCMY